MYSDCSIVARLVYACFNVILVTTGEQSLDLGCMLLNKRFLYLKAPVQQTVLVYARSYIYLYLTLEPEKTALRSRNHVVMYNTYRRVHIISSWASTLTSAQKRGGGLIIRTFMR